MNYKEKLALYKKEILGVSKAGKFIHNGKTYYKDYILPEEEADKNIMIEKSGYKHLNGNVIELNQLFNGNLIKITLHRYWNHLNSSQILALNYFFDFLNDSEKLNCLLKFFGIDEKAVAATLEHKMNEHSEIDVAIELENGKFVFIEIKYSELKFGSATSKTTDYISRKEQYYSAANISLENFKKHYQFVRNIILGVDGNYSVFLVPRFNESIMVDYNKSRETISNVTDFNTRIFYWEDLLNSITNDKVKEKYFLGL